MQRILVETLLKSRYRGSYLGVVWSIAGPLFSAFIYYLLTKYALHFEDNYFFLMLLSGILPWSFFNGLVGQGVSSIVMNKDIYVSLGIPLVTIPLSISIGNFIHYLIPLTLLSLLALVLGHIHPTSLVAFFYFNFLLFIFCHEFNFFVAKIYVFFRDITHFLPSLFQLWFYLTPILYSSNFLTGKAKLIIILNPLGHLFIGLRNTLSGTSFSSEVIFIPLFWIFFLKLISLTIQKFIDKRLLEFL